MPDQNVNGGRFEKTKRGARYGCSECGEFELRKKFRGVVGTPGEAEYELIEAPDQCPACGGEIESSQDTAGAQNGGSTNA